MFSDLDENSPKFSGVPVDWGRWDNYLDDVVCRCAQLSKAKGFNYFGIENFGEYMSQVAFKKVECVDGYPMLCGRKSSDCGKYTEASYRYFVESVAVFLIDDQCLFVSTALKKGK